MEPERAAGGLLSEDPGEGEDSAGGSSLLQSCRDGMYAINVCMDIHVYCTLCNAWILAREVRGNIST